MTDLEKLAELIFPDVTQSIDDLEKQYQLELDKKLNLRS